MSTFPSRLNLLLLATSLLMFVTFVSFVYANESGTHDSNNGSAGTSGSSGSSGSGGNFTRDYFGSAVAAARDTALAKAAGSTDTYSAQTTYSGGVGGYSVGKNDQPDGNGGGGLGGPGYTGGTYTFDQAPLGDINNPIPGYGSGSTNSCNVISGWTCDRDFSDKSLVVNIRQDGKLLTTMLADLASPGLIDPPWYGANASWGKGCGPSSVARWDFRFPTPGWMKDGVKRNVQVFAHNLGTAGDYTVKLPHAPWSVTGKDIPVQCSPVVDMDLAATMRGVTTQQEGVAFTINSVKVSNEGGQNASVSIPVVLQFDKKNGNGTDAWKYEGDGVNGDVRKLVPIPGGLVKGASASVIFKDVILPKGEYRVRAVVDPGFTIEANSTTHQANNSSIWQYFTVNEAPPATGNFEAVSAANCTVSGWAYDPSNQTTAIDVHVYEGSPASLGRTPVVVCTANTSRPDLKTNLGLTNVDHGFTCLLPDSYKDGVSRKYYIHAIDIDKSPNNVISGSPKFLSCIKPPPKLILCPKPVPDLLEKETTQLKALYWSSAPGTASCGDSTGRDVTNISTWTSSDKTNVTVSATGRATAVSWGSSIVKVTYGGLSDSDTFNIKPLPPEITLTPVNSVIRYGDTGQLKLTIKADYQVTCTITGDGGSSQKIVHAGINSLPESFTINTKALTSKQTITATCTSKAPGIGDVQKAQVIEVVPKTQEV